MSVKQSPEYKFFSAYEAYNRAKNPAFKQYWYKVMVHFWKEFP